LHAALLDYWSLHQSERLRRDVTSEHAAQQQRASETPLDQAARVCLLMHVGVGREVLDGNRRDRLCRLWSR
jgi:hypothetical protein